MIYWPPLTAPRCDTSCQSPYPVQVGCVVFPPDTSVPGATVGAAHPAPLSWQLTALAGLFRNI
ncbi:hypothetical protein GCM10010332_19590 [Streptomyces albogriseolus]|nr:hypothetical protein GCM10010332_19590 [Streptomyces albogriseolus]